MSPKVHQLSHTQVTPPLEIGFVQVIKSYHHELEWPICQKLLPQLLGEGLPKYDCFGNYVSAAGHLMSNEVPSPQHANVFMAFECTRISVPVAMKLVGSGAVVALFQYEEDLSYSSVDAVNDPVFSETRNRSSAEMKFLIFLPTGHYHVRCMADDRSFSNLKTEIEWQPHVGPAVKLSQLPVTLTPTNNRGYQGD